VRLYSLLFHGCASLSKEKVAGGRFPS